MNTKKAIIIIPYFGNFPSEFPFWVASCGRNGKAGYDWLLITDQVTEKYSIPDNMRVVKCSFDELKERIQSKFDFKISLQKPQKLCDYKPAYGLIFEDYIYDYQYWGYCDMDLIFGKLDHFLKEPIERKFEKILTLGHLSLYLNNEKMKYAFQLHREGCLFYRDVYTSNQGMTFDEDGWPLDTPLKGIKTLFAKCGLKIWDAPSAFADVEIGTYSIDMMNSKNKETKQGKTFYVIANGKVMRVYPNETGSFCKEELMYMHAQKRKWIISASNTEQFLFVPPGHIVKYDDDFRKITFNYSKGGLLPFIWKLKQRVKKRLKYLPHNIKHIIHMLRL